MNESKCRGAVQSIKLPITGFAANALQCNRNSSTNIDLILTIN